MWCICSTRLLLEWSESGLFHYPTLEKSISRALAWSAICMANIFLVKVSWKMIHEISEWTNNVHGNDSYLRQITKQTRRSPNLNENKMKKSDKQLENLKSSACTNLISPSLLKRGDKMNIRQEKFTNLQLGTQNRPVRVALINNYPKNNTIATKNPGNINEYRRNNQSSQRKTREMNKSSPPEKGKALRGGWPARARALYTV